MNLGRAQPPISLQLQVTPKLPHLVSAIRQTDFLDTWDRPFYGDSNQLGSSRASQIKYFAHFRPVEVARDCLVKSRT